MARPRRAQLVVEAVIVLCPYCEAAQPSPDNFSDMWTVQNFEKKSGVFPCVACDKPIDIAHHGTAVFA